ncbi:Leucine-rich repeat (LRR) protein associated with apoptosis in muscle tissue [Handroanthus impetiginosus]|uniref:Leucine-rich repeat (LRR) protein associated with apoptosis in muscle tissue n=1 Tax=Handroanthus impetiginosus TaxID=429701 RepID=A0A2G9I0Y6_9LAMI|nr:Leucine-rich repeat (LRR) protein associated with apoptosis in muscle tissue [Handroanthus impetiginosus]
MNLSFHSLPFFFILISTIFLLIHIIFVNSKTHPDDIQVLKQLKNGIDPNSISSGSCLSSWDFSLDPCDRIFTDRFTCGFRCDLIVSGSYRVTEITLDQAGYSGSLSHISFNLPYLDTLDLSYNSLSGSIPVSLTNLTLLHRLSLSKNSFSGSIPPSLGLLSRLQELYLDNNLLTGSIPPSFNRLVSLKRLELQQNNLSGELPNLSQLRNLYYLDLSDNIISGQVLEKIMPLSIIELSFRNNSLRDEFNVNVAELRFLQVLDLSYNKLNGMIPSFLFDHPSLQQLTISNNKFRFLQAPTNMGLTSGLVAIDLSYNELHGLLPAFMAWMPKLSALSLEHNKFTGMIPPEYARKTVVPGRGTAPFRRLLLGGNYLFGPIPGQLMALKPGSVTVSLVDNCLNRCPDSFFFCQGADQKSLVDCKNFGPAIP